MCLKVFRNSLLALWDVLKTCLGCVWDQYYTVYDIKHSLLFEAWRSWLLKYDCSVGNPSWERIGPLLIGRARWFILTDENDSRLCPTTHSNDIIASFNNHFLCCWHSSLTHGWHFCCIKSCDVSKFGWLFPSAKNFLTVYWQ